MSHLNEASGRNLVFTQSDAQAFVDELRRRFANVVLLEFNMYPARDPYLCRVCDTLSEFEGDGRSADVFLCEPGVDVSAGERRYRKDMLKVSIAAIRLPWDRPQRVGSYADALWQTIPEVWLSVGYRTGDRALKDKIMRAMAKVCEPERVSVYWPSLIPFRSQRDRLWVGRDAAQWCRGGEWRVLGMHGIVGGAMGTVPTEVARSPVSS